MALKIVAPPATEPVTLTEAKKHLRADDFDTDDALITSLITVAREDAEDFLNRALLTQTYELWLDAWPEHIKVPMPPLQSVTHIKYYDAESAEHTLAATEYFVDNKSEPGRIIRTGTWPGGLRKVNGICVTFVAGYANDASIPAAFKQAMLLTIGHYYENREDVLTVGHIARELPMGARHLLMKRRVWPI